jgi:1-acyl-sn-glycerol-3-phosphate acyltransferase
VKHLEKERLEERLSVRLAQAANRIFARIYHHTIVRSPSRLPAKGPAILVCNHISGLDPLLIQSACRRMIVWMMAREYYDIPGLNWFFKRIDAIPVERSGRDSAATRAALRALARGNVLGVFPEGRIETDHELLPFQTGVAMMAMKTGVDVYPAYIDGTQRGREMLQAFAIPNDVHLSFGSVITFDGSNTSRDALDVQTNRIRQEVSTLRLQELRHKLFLKKGDGALPGGAE